MCNDKIVVAMATEGLKFEESDKMWKGVLTVNFGKTKISLSLT